jgi:hypothetical protein
MEAEKKLDTIEEELKLMKGELKQSLASVRDYLLNMELPSTEFSTILAALGDGEQNMTMKGSFSLPPEGLSSDEVADEPSESKIEPTSDEEDLTGSHEDAGAESALAPDEEDLISSHEDAGPESALAPDEELIGPPEDLETESELPPEDEFINQDENLEPKANQLSPDEAGEPLEGDGASMPEPELSVEEEPSMEYEKINNELGKSIPKVSLLANLINWIARAKREIGDEQLPSFLEVYGISGHLSPELKDVIMNLSEITSEQPGDANKAEIWSQSMLSLHGILMGGDAPLRPIKPSWNEVNSEIKPSEDERVEVDKAKETPIKLKLVLPNGNGKSKEYCLDLAPEADTNGS